MHRVPVCGDKRPGYNAVMSFGEQNPKRWRPWRVSLRVLLFLTLGIGVFLAGRLSVQTELLSVQKELREVRQEKEYALDKLGLEGGIRNIVRILPSPSGLRNSYPQGVQPLSNPARETSREELMRRLLSGKNTDTVSVEFESESPEPQSFDGTYEALGEKVAVP